MKKLFVLIVFTVAVLFAGCQDNNITDPAVSPSLNKTANTVEPNNTGYINLKSVLKDPNSALNQKYDLSGMAEYTLQMKPVRVVDPVVQEYDIAIDLSIAAELIEEQSLVDPNVMPATWDIRGELMDRVYVKPGTAQYIDKSFSIEGRRDGLTLLCEFEVKPLGIALKSVKLERPDRISVN